MDWFDIKDNTNFLLKHLRLKEHKRLPQRLIGDDSSKVVEKKCPEGEKTMYPVAVLVISSFPPTTNAMFLWLITPFTVNNLIEISDSL